MTNRIAHFISLNRVGGIERHYSQLINHRDPAVAVEHHSVLTKNGIAPPLASLIQQGSASISAVKQIGFLRLPRRPSGLRSYHRNRILDKIDPDVAVLWSNPTAFDLHRLRTAAKIYYYEHGAVWFNRDFKGLKRQFEKIDAIICNSRAAKRMIQLKWRIDASIRIDVCLNAVRPDSLPKRIRPKSFCGDRPFRLGIAGRMNPVKGFALAIHAVRILADRGFSCELLVGGTGEERQRLADLVAELGLENQVKFLGFVNDMAAFYSAVDCFVCPSVREPFGLVCAEALANGCPVISSNIDGLTEVVDHLQTGFCLSPTLPIERYPRFGGSSATIPRFVYNPEKDTVEAPKFLDPESIAEAVANLMTDANTYVQMSQAALRSAQTKFDFAAHARRVLQALIR